LQAVDAGNYPGGVAPTTSVEAANADVQTKLAALLLAQGNLNKGTGDEAAVNTARQNLATSEKALQTAQEQANKYNLATGDGELTRCLRPSELTFS
jgi:hypothetical protein